jgi:aminoglycoside phosphotransferase
MSAVPRTNLAALAKRLSPDKIVEMLVSALKAFHSANTSGCPFKSYMPGESLVRSDACLPNIVGRDDGTVNGYIDLGEIGASAGHCRSCRRPAERRQRGGQYANREPS